MLANSDSFLDEHVPDVQLVEAYDTLVNGLTDPLESQVRDLSITTSANETERRHIHEFVPLDLRILKILFPARRQYGDFNLLPFERTSNHFHLRNAMRVSQKNANL